MKNINLFYYEISPEFKKLGPAGQLGFLNVFCLDAMVIFKFRAFRIENYQMSPVPDNSLLLYSLYFLASEAVSV